MLAVFPAVGSFSMPHPSERNRAVSTAKAVTDQSFEAEVLTNPRPVIVEYWAPWCGPCRQIGPVLDAIAAEYAGRVDVVKVNTDENPESMTRYGVMMVPTINLFSGGEVVKQVIGAKSKSALLREFADFI
jgi:thioredoxin 1